ncbi:hypothetical protein [Salibacterium sp. K-3]
MRKSGIAVVVSLIFQINMIDSVDADTWVDGYFRDDGTHVEGHFRSDRDGNFWNNYSSYGNINPYTGERGTRLPYDNNNSSFESGMDFGWSRDSYNFGDDASYDTGYGAYDTEYDSAGWEDHSYDTQYPEYDSSFNDGGTFHSSDSYFNSSNDRGSASFDSFDSDIDSGYDSGYDW